MQFFVSFRVFYYLLLLIGQLNWPLDNLHKMQRHEELTSDSLLQAFIDAYELSSLINPEDSNQVPAASQAQRKAQRQPAGRRRRDAKQELEQLRQDVQRLKAKLELVQAKMSAFASTRGSTDPAVATRQSTSGSAPPPETSIWMEVALHQLKRLQQSHSTNRRLKQLLGKQLKIAKCLENAFLHKLHEEVSGAPDNLSGSPTQWQTPALVLGFECDVWPSRP